MRQTVTVLSGIFLAGLGLSCSAGKSSGTGGATGAGSGGTTAGGTGGATATGTGGATVGGTGGTTVTGTGGATVGGTGGATATGGTGSGGTGTGGRGGAGTAGAAGGRGGTAGAATGGMAAGGRGGVVGTGGAAGGATGTLADPCRGTALPVAQHHVPAGLCARSVATGQGELRQLTFSSNGDLWGVTGAGQIRRYRDANADGIFQSGEIVNWASTGGNGQNVHIDEAGGFLYSGTSAGVRRWAWTSTTDAGGTGQDVLTGQPTGGHGKHTVHVWGGWMYVMSGSSGNVTNPSAPNYDAQRSLIKRFNLASFTPGTPFTWSTGGEIFTDGLRNTLGFNQDAMGRIFGVQNGQDDVTYAGADVHNDNPGEIIARIDAGLHHGYPFCMVAQRINALAAGTLVRSEIFSGNTRDDAWCQNATNVAKPVTFMPAHTAPMEIVFFTGPAGALPEKWRNGAFVSLHGSWNRMPAAGYRVVWVPFNVADGTSPMPTNSGTTTTFPHEVVLSGGNASAPSASGTWNWTGGEQNVRPVGLAVSPIDGALYISSDSQGYIYRVGMQR